MRERLTEVSDSEAKSCFLGALPTRLQSIILKKEEELPGKLPLATLESHLRTKIETEEKRLSLQKQLSGTVATVSSDKPATLSAKATENIQVVHERQFQLVQNNRWSPRPFNGSRSNSQSSQRRGTQPGPFQSNSTNQAPASKSVQCFYCHGFGHVQLFCPKRKADRTAQQTRTSRDSRCTFCGRSGHTKALCFGKQLRQDPNSRFRHQGNKLSPCGGRRSQPATPRRQSA